MFTANVIAIRWLFASIAGGFAIAFAVANVRILQSSRSARIDGGRVPSLIPFASPIAAIIAAILAPGFAPLIIVPVVFLADPGSLWLCWDLSVRRRKAAKERSTGK